MLKSVFFIHVGEFLSYFINIVLGDLCMNKAFNFILVLHKSVFHFLNRYHMHISLLFGVHCCQYWFFVQILGLYYFCVIPQSCSICI